MSTSNRIADVQAAQQDYLNDKKVNALFDAITEALLVEKPENPIGFMIKYLSDEYPLEVKEHLPRLSPTVESIPAVRDYSSGEETDESDSGGESETDATTPNAKLYSRKRRNAVSEEVLSPTTVNNAEIKLIPKTEEEAKSIQQTLKKNVFLQKLAEEELATVQDAMFPVRKETGEVITKQGDDGDNFYIIDSGKVEVFRTSNEDEPGNLVTAYSDGDFFGELALLHNAPRAATCIAASPVKLWAIDRFTFKVILMKAFNAKRDRYKGFLRKVPILSQLTEYEVLAIADSLQEETFQKGEDVCKEGNTGDKLYIVKEGTAVCTQLEGSSSKEVARLSSGSYFGEIALMSSKTRQATVTASEKTCCLSLDRKTFERVMGPLKEVLMRNMEEYNKFQAANFV